MKTKIAKEFKLPESPEEAIKVLFKQVRDITDDVIAALTGKLTVNDNLPFVYITQRVNNGVVTELKRPDGKITKGVLVVYSNGATVASLMTKKSPDGMQIIVIMDKNTADITFMLLGE